MGCLTALPLLADTKSVLVVDPTEPRFTLLSEAQESQGQVRQSLSLLVVLPGEPSRKEVLVVQFHIQVRCSLPFMGVCLLKGFLNKEFS